MICSILIEYKIPIIFSQNPKDTAEFMAILFNRSKKESPLIPKRKGLTKNEKIRRVIEAFPEIGPKNSKKLLEKFKTLKNIFSQEEEVKKILNKKSKNFFEILNGEYKIIENKKD
jgi:Fanconi anemia group M protein